MFYPDSAASVPTGPRDTNPGDTEVGRQITDLTGKLLRGLTDNGRIPFRLALSRLTVWEALLVQHLLGRSDAHWLDQPTATSGLIRVTSAKLTGLAFWNPVEPDQPADNPLAWLSVPPQVLDMVNEEASAIAAREAAEAREVEEILRSWEREGGLDRRVATLQDLVERVETVYVFVGRDVYSKSDASSNTLTRDNLLGALRGTPTSAWRPGDRLFVVAAHCLFLSGRSVRFEEFNGRQLTAVGLREFLTDRYANYCRAAGRDPVDLRLPLLDLAERVRDLMDEADHSNLMRYRRVNGLTFVKNEYLAEIPLPRDHTDVPGLLAEHARTALGVIPSGDVRADVRSMTRAAAGLDTRGPGNPDPTGGIGALGELLSAIVLSAVHETDSDYGMSSSVRDLAGLRGATPGAADGVLTLKKGDFFCCCLPHARRMADVGEQTVPILWRAAQRMMYNRWHFIPGEFERADIPDRRHYFFPPQIPDIAEHAEHHHGGHVASRVRFSLRAPGAQVWHPPFTVFGHGFRGCYDIRLVRMEGPAYTLAELAEAVRHCSLVDEFWRTLADGLERGAFAVRPINGFDKAWYAARAWENTTPYTITSGRLAEVSGL